jgi:hypothetical protein
MFDAQQMVTQIKTDHRRTVKAMHRELEKNKQEANKILEVQTPFKLALYGGTIALYGPNNPRFSSLFRWWTPQSSTCT